MQFEAPIKTFSILRVKAVGRHNYSIKTDVVYVCTYRVFYVMSYFLFQAKSTGASSNRWLLVNIQNAKEFPCQVLNRDVWSNQTVKAIINEHFVFWQVRMSVAHRVS